MTWRMADLLDVAADTGDVVVYGAFDTPGEQMLHMRLRLNTHTVGVGSILVTVKWHDGLGPQEWNLSLSPTTDNYAEQGQSVWHDYDTGHDVTLRVQELVPGGSIDVVLLGGES